MQGNYNNGRPYYRCRYTAEYAKNVALEHPLTVYVRQNAILPALDTWLARVFAPGHLGRTIRVMCESQQRQPVAAPALEAARQTIAETNRRIDRYRAARCRSRPCGRSRLDHRRPERAGSRPPTARRCVGRSAGDPHRGTDPPHDQDPRRHGRPAPSSRA
ncbi:hypothetical protein [Streptomyces sp. NPDC058773]|uniref:hypothetical protein n=1 Tax=Streptomyces sp. NPDC058773 TaxID=3346632 RepID=UPI0036C25481